MKAYFFIIAALLPTFAYSAEADVFKCKSAGGSVVYQKESCSPTAKQKIIQVETQTPEQREQAEAQLREWQDQQAVQEAENAAKAQKEQAQQEELARQQAEQQQRMQQERAIQAQQQPSGINRRFGYMPNSN